MFAVDYLRYTMSCFYIISSLFSCPSIQVALGVAYLHERGVVHRDLKAANVMLNVERGEEVALVADFGLASRRLGIHTTAIPADLNLAFAAPEVLNGCTPSGSKESDCEYEY